MRRKNVSFKECPDAAPRATLIVAAGRAQHGRAYREGAQEEAGHRAILPIWISI
jgi:hypothetical protein